MTTFRFLPAVLLFVGALGCDGVEGDLLRERAAPAELDSGAPTDTGTISPSCLSADAAFRVEPPFALTELNSPFADYEPTPSADGTRLVFTSDRPGGLGGADLYIATRTTTDSPFETIDNYASVNTAANEFALAESPDGTVAILVTDAAGGAGLSDLWTATRASVDIPFQRSDFSPVATLNTDRFQHDPFFSADGSRLYFTSERFVATDSGSDLVQADRSGTTFGNPELVPGLNFASTSEGRPTLTSDERVIVFNANRDLSPTPQGPAFENGLWYATRPSRDAAFSTPERLPGVNTAVREWNAVITADGCGVYFVRETVDASSDLYFARIVRENP